MFKKILFVVASLVVIYFLIIWGEKLAVELILPGQSFYSLSIKPQNINFNSDGLLISAYFYKPSNNKKNPVIILVHGLNSKGKDFKLYKLISDKLANDGTAVLSIDMRGFNESEDPKEINSFHDFDLTDDVLNAVSEIKKIKNIDTSKIFLLGHSLGAGVVLDALSRDTTHTIKGVISIEPDRSGRKFDFPAYTVRLKHDLKLSYNVPVAVAETLEYHTNLEFLSDKLKGKHAPILFVETEKAERHNFFLIDYSKISQPKKFIVIKKTYHYFGTYHSKYKNWQSRFYKVAHLIPGSPDIIYDKLPLDSLIVHIEKFIRESD